MPSAKPQTGEFVGLIVAALVLLVVLVVVFISMQLHWQTNASQAAAVGQKSQFLPGLASVSPGFGLTTGAVTSIDDFRPCYGGLGCGILGIPP